MWRRFSVLYIHIAKQLVRFSTSLMDFTDSEGKRKGFKTVLSSGSGWIFELPLLLPSIGSGGEADVHEIGGYH